MNSLHFCNQSVLTWMCIISLYVMHVFAVMLCCNNNVLIVIMSVVTCNVGLHEALAIVCREKF